MVFLLCAEKIFFNSLYFLLIENGLKQENVMQGFA